MSEQFKAGDAVELTDRAGLNLDQWVFEVGKVELRDGRIYVWPRHGLHGGVDSRRLRIAEPAPGDGSGLKGSWLDPLKAEKAALLSRISEIDKQIEAEAQGDGLSRLKAIVGETGYFMRSQGWQSEFFKSGGQPIEVEENGVQVGFDEGFRFRDDHNGSAICGIGMCFPRLDDLEGWQSITMERFLRAKSDYEDIVGKVKEAMEP